ncbi:hypothetical protein ABZW32_00225 [Streptomyces sp. NPDC004667]|uniref:hypothetical protein n=1 Tax=Streptomyces sp. NPDC004667 TaxID=3154285 RepID=UPI0033B2B746
MFRSTTTTTARRATTAALALSLAVLTAACGNDATPKASSAPSQAPSASAPSDPSPVSTASGPSGAASAAPSPRVPGGTPPMASPADGGVPATPGPEKVRDAFAGLQATLGESCTPGNCAYFLGRVHDELHRMDRAMKADPKGPGHFPEPIAAVAKLDLELGGDRTFENLKKHQSTLIGTRDEINTWMQDHPDDYR